MGLRAFQWRAMDKDNVSKALLEKINIKFNVQLQILIFVQIFRDSIDLLL